ncbi:MAG: hypothetical protein GY849_03960, partial [Deltaproteobacteria bacterium]|nr:hypothetical protein [Deltaproteobacteria bacterium]
MFKVFTRFPEEERFALMSQVSRASVSMHFSIGEQALEPLSKIPRCCAGNPCRRSRVVVRGTLVEDPASFCGSQIPHYSAGESSTPLSQLIGRRTKLSFYFQIFCANPKVIIGCGSSGMRMRMRAGVKPALL